MTRSYKSNSDVIRKTQCCLPFVLKTIIFARFLFKNDLCYDVEEYTESHESLDGVFLVLKIYYYSFVRKFRDDQIVC